MIETKNNFPSPEMLERIAAALGVDTVTLFSKENDTPEIMKIYLKAALEDIKGSIGRLIDEKFKEMEKKS